MNFPGLTFKYWLILQYHFHSNRLEELHRHFPPAMLPESLGGELAWEDAFENDLIPRVKGNDDFYEKMAK